MPRETLVDLVRDRAALEGEAVYLRYLISGDIAGPTAELTYGELARRAAAMAVELQQHGAVGDRVLLVFPPGLDFVTAFFGCLFAGMAPVPTYPPDVAKTERTIAKLRGIVADCGARFALTTSKLLPTIEDVTRTDGELANVRWLTTDTCDVTLGELWRAPAITSETVALVQYTSGSTGAPKGAVIRHRQLLANGKSIAASMGPTGVVVGWLPVFHDMGLIGNVLQVLHAGTSLIWMSPLAFLKRPARWLEAISHHRATTAGGPNFAYDLCVRRVTEEQRAQLDLRSWEVAFCGAEPVREPTIERFCAAFEASGFSRSAFYPCYGLAEATLFVTGNQRGTPPRSCTVRASALERGEVIVAANDDVDRCTLVSCGRPAASEDVRIVDPDLATPAASNRVGEIWVRGPAIASGYWGRDEENRATFGAQLGNEGPFLRTGDLGFFHDEELYIAGRRKDLIILGGRNLFPQDIEATVEAAAPSVRSGCSVAFSIEGDNEEKLVIVAEHGTSPDADEVMRAIKIAVATQHQAAVFDVVLVKKGSIPKTSSGKLERYACRKAYLAGAYGFNRTFA